MADCPRIYVASLSDYNCGTLHGVWIELDEYSDYDDVMETVERMLAASPSVAAGESDVAEEFAIHDHDGFHGYRVSDYASLRELVPVAAAIAEHGIAMAEWLDLSSADTEDAIEQFDDVYVGEWESEEDWAWDEFRELHPEAYKLVNGSDCVRFDPESYVNTARCDGYEFVSLGGGSVAVLNKEAV